MEIITPQIPALNVLKNWDDFFKSDIRLDIIAVSWQSLALGWAIIKLA